MLETYNLPKQKHEKTSIPCGWNGTPRAPLLGMGSYGSMEEWRRGRVNDLRGKWSQGTHMGSIMIWSEGVI